MQSGKLGHTPTIHTLPPELLVQVLSSLDVTSLGKASAVCKHWHNIINHCQELWRALCNDLVDRKEYVMRDRAMGHSWKEVFMMNYGINLVRRKWCSGTYSNVEKYEDLPSKLMCTMEVDVWGEIFQMELER